MAVRRVYKVRFGVVYPLYLAKAEKTGRTKDELDQIIRWLTGVDQAGLEARISDDTTMEDFFVEAPALHPARVQITGRVCGVRVEDVEEETMREIRYLDKLVDELVKGKAIEVILRG